MKKDGSQGLSNHELFEKWRNKTAQERWENWSEYRDDLETSYDRYQDAWGRALNRLGLDEKAALASFNKVVASLPKARTKLSFKSSAEKVPGPHTPSTRTTGTSKSPLSGNTITRPSSSLIDTTITSTSEPKIAIKTEKGQLKIFSERIQLKLTTLN